MLPTYEMTTYYQLVRAANRAAASGDRKMLDRALSDPRWNVDDVDSLLALDDDSPPRTTALAKAVRSGDAQCVQLLLSAGASTTFGVPSALDEARRLSNAEIVTLLEQAGSIETCEICVEDVDAAMRKEWRARPVSNSCNHTRAVCFTCVRRHIEAEINEKGNPAITCPHNECNQQLGHADIQHFATPRQFERYDLVIMRRCLQSLPDFVWCAHRDCGSGQETEGAGVGKAIEGGLRGLWLRCHACNRRTCLHHSCAMHEGMSCEEYDAAARDSEEVGLLQYLNSDSIRRCPKCRHGIEKNEGCDHMTCRKSSGGCGAEFCWRCGADYNGPNGIRAVGNSAHAASCPYNF